MPDSISINLIFEQKVQKNNSWAQVFSSDVI